MSMGLHSCGLRPQRSSAIRSFFLTYDDKGECLPCSKCCGDGQDLVEEECQLKLGAGSNMICSFNSSANWCDKITATPDVITTTNINTFTLTSATVSTGSSHDNPDLSKRKDFLDFTALYVAVPLLGCVPLLVIVGCVCYFRYARQKQSNLCHWVVQV